jgi:ParB-like chromosome segregation protein Spo0J
MATTRNFPLDLLTPVRHVATELDRAAPAALSVSEMAKTYTHPNPGDMARVRSAYVGEQGDVSRWFIETAIGELGHRIASDGNGGYHLVVPLGKMKYTPGGGRSQRLVKAERERDETLDNDALADESTRQEARAAMYVIRNDDRPFTVMVGKRERKLRLHKLAKALPLMGEDEFAAFIADVRAHGVLKPVLVIGDEVLDGRHRVAAADLLNVAVRLEEFTGTEEQAVERVLSENVHRRHLTVAQRGLIVWEMFMPQAISEAEHGGDRRSVSRAPSGALETSGKAVEIAARRSNGLASSKTIERMRPVADAPETKERIRRGEIATATEARREALVETSRHDEPADPSTNFRPQTAYTYLGSSLRELRKAAAAMSGPDARKVDVVQCRERLCAIRQLVADVETALS